MASVPYAPKRPHEITQHGITRIDNYYWMRNREDPEVMKYLHAENDYLEEMMAHTKPLQTKLFEEMKARIKEDDMTVPEKQGNYFYYSRTAAGKQYPIYCRKKGSLDAPEEIILDQNVLAEGQSFSRIGAFAISPDDTKLAYSIDPDGSEVCTLYIKDLLTGTLLPERFMNTYGEVYGHSGAEWSNDGRLLFYQTMDEALRPYRIFRHVIGTDQSEDQLLYEECDETFFLWLTKSRSQAFIQANSQSTMTDEWRILPADGASTDFKIFQARRAGIEYQIEHAGDRFFIITNENAQNLKLMETPIHATTKENWRELIPHRPDILITGMDAFEDFLALYERKDGFRQIRISAADGKSNPRNVIFPEPVYTFYPMHNPEYKTNVLRLFYTSLITPNSVIDYHVDTDQWEIKKQDEIRSGYDSSQYVSERTYATAPDGVKVPMSIVYKKGIKKDGTNPALLYGYGSYGFSTDPWFDLNRLSLLDRGFIFAIGHIRGGSEMGRSWYDDGKLLNKKNTFTDFIACAEQLIKVGYTSKGKLAIMSKSAGGLLVGACMIMRPDLFKTVIAQVPFVDVVTSMSDPTIPLTTLEYDQWGNPANKEHFDYMLSYSPYDNIRATEYPHLLLTTGLNDPRVAYWEPTKFAAKLRELKIDNNQLLLKTDFDSGHAGASGRYDLLKDAALEYAFLIDHVGM
jgi:oligopeptidase B